MSRLFPVFKIFLMVAGLGLAVRLPAQETQIPPQTNPAGTNIPEGQLPDLQNRIQQLRDAGVPDSEILKRIQSQSGGIPGITQPVSPSQAGSVSPIGSAQENIQLEGTQEVLDGEDDDYDDKPETITQVFIPPGEPSNIFGHAMFRDTTQNFIKALSPVPAENYVVGAGDRFTITIWGCSELSESLTIAADGAVFRTYIGKIYLAGLTYKKAVAILEERYRGIVSSCAQIEVFMGRSQRTLSVNIVGEVYRPGSYQINAAVPAFNALFEAGGITNIGSVRNILIKRGGRTIQILDVYDFLINGNEEPIYLQDNDFIYVPVQEKVVTVEGAVKRAMDFELRESENLKDLIRFTGGLNYDALRNDAQISRLENGREVLINFHLDSILTSSDRDYRLLGGDKLIIRTLNKGAYNIVQIFGNLEYPGTYQLLPGERVSDLIRRAGGLGMDAYLDRAYIIRIVPTSDEVLYIPVNLNNIFEGASPENNLELQYFDALMIFSKSEFRDQRFIEVTGQVRKPGTFQTHPTMTLKDLLFLTGGLRENADFNNVELLLITKPEDLAETSLLGKDDTNNETEGAETPTPIADQPILEPGPEDQIIRRIAIDKNWQEDPMIDTLLIHGFNMLRIYSIYDFIHYKFIDIEGSVKNPGRFQITQGMTVKDLLYMAGGLTQDADVNEVELYRDIDPEEMGLYGTGTNKREIERIRIDKDWQNGHIVDSIEVAGYRKMVIRSERDFLSQGFIEVKGLVNKPGRFEVLPNMSLLDVIYMAQGIKMEADFENIELSRIIETIDETGEVVPVPWLLKKVSINQNWQEDSTLDQIRVNSFDQVFIRKNPYFELQESVFITGEVINEGEYLKAQKDEPLSSLVGRAGGITSLADLKGSHLNRVGIGNVALKLDKALRRPGSKYDIHLLEGDTLIIPPRLDIVRISGNVLKPGTTVLYEPGKKKLKYYVNLAGGYDRRSHKKMTTVSYVDGRVKRTKKFLVIRDYPKIEQGSVIEVAVKPEKGKFEFRPWEKIPLAEIISTTTSLLTFILLIDTIRNR
ncbi:MAG: SLBB domain-containing protein [Bacteroidia bacterium]|nr:SLBB domain-containing protein [Bacteroidia bacterium]